MRFFPWFRFRKAASRDLSLVRRWRLRRARAAARRMAIESLEQRTLLSATVYYWDGVGDTGTASVNNHWTTGTNWVGDQAPTAGSELIFPSGAAQLTSVNDFSPGAHFDSIVISGSGYTLSGASVQLQSGVTSSGSSNEIDLPLTLEADQGIANNSSNKLIVGGAIDLGAHTLTLGGTGSGETALNGAISGSGGLIQSGAGTAVLAVANSYSGGTQVNSGTLTISNGGALGTGDGTTATGTSVASGATLDIDGPLTVSNELLSIANNGILASNGAGTNVWTGDISSAYGFYLMPASNNSLEVDGNLTTNLNYDVTDYYSGRLILEGASNSIGYLYSPYGIVEVDGGLSLSYGVETDLAGTGTVTVGNGRTLTIDTSLTPGTASTPGVLQVNTVTMQSQTSFNVQIGGSTPGDTVSNYSQLQVSGPVTLAGTLNVTLTNAFAPTPGEQFTILTATSPISGTFAGTGEGGLVLVNGVVFQISYQGGSGGDDVVLTCVTADVWSGAGGDADWKTASNWVADQTPSPGDNLIFPANAQQMSNTNNFDPGTAFGSILISGSGYTLGGESVQLQGGVTSSGSTNEINLPLTLEADQGIANNSSNELIVGGAIDLGAHTLTLGGTGSGETALNGAISGSGGLIQSGAGTAVLAVANSYSGGTQVNSGTLTISNGGALGTGDGTTATGTSVASGATLDIDGPLTVSNELLSIANNGILASNGAGTNVWTGDISSAVRILSHASVEQFPGGGRQSHDKPKLRRHGLLLGPFDSRGSKQQHRLSVFSLWHRRGGWGPFLVVWGGDRSCRYGNGDGRQRPYLDHRHLAYAGHGFDPWGTASQHGYDAIPNEFQRPDWRKHAGRHGEQLQPVAGQRTGHPGRHVERHVDQRLRTDARGTVHDPHRDQPDLGHLRRDGRGRSGAGQRRCLPDQLPGRQRRRRRGIDLRDRRRLERGRRRRRLEDGLQLGRRPDAQPGR